MSLFGLLMKRPLLGLIESSFCRAVMIIVDSGIISTCLWTDSKITPDFFCFRD